MGFGTVGAFGVTGRTFEDGVVFRTTFLALRGRVAGGFCMSPSEAGIASRGIWDV